MNQLYAVLNLFYTHIKELARVLIVGMFVLLSLTFGNKTLFLFV